MAKLVRITVDDDELVEKVRRLTGARTDREAVETVMREFIRDYWADKAREEGKTAKNGGKKAR